MNCAEFEAILPDLLEEGGTAEQKTHLTDCAACSGLVADIRMISQEAKQLRACDEPSPRVWNSIEIALRQEGLIHESPLKIEPSIYGSARRWTLAWLVPTTAAFLVTFGLLRLQHPATPSQTAEQATASAPAVAAVSTPAVSSAPTHRIAETSSEDRQLLEEVGTRSPAMRASYETELRDVNSYIQDAENSARANPDDEEAQEYLMNAYDQKAMVYELAMDRSLP
jgi:hypothetical protein